MAALFGGGGPATVAAGAPTGVLQLPNELLVRIIRMMRVSLALPHVLTRVKMTCWQLCKLIRSEMQSDLIFQTEIKNVLRIPGSNVPCGADTVPVMYYPTNAVDLMNMMENTGMGAGLHPNGIRVSMMYDYLFGNEPFMRMGFMRQDCTALYVVVALQFKAKDYFCVPTVPLLSNNMADLSKVPDAFRVAENTLGLTHDYTAMLAHMNDVECYMRLLRVGPQHTAQDVQDALTAAEGWNADNEDRVHRYHKPDWDLYTEFDVLSNQVKLHGDANIFAEFDLAQAQDNKLSLCISWPVDIAKPGVPAAQLLA